VLGQALNQPCKKIVDDSDNDNDNYDDDNNGNTIKNNKNVENRHGNITTKIF
jgi:hypothetical protein